MASRIALHDLTGLILAAEPQEAGETWRIYKTQQSDRLWLTPQALVAKK